jgi:hypothetical protein
VDELPHPVVHLAVKALQVKVDEVMVLEVANNSMPLTKKGSKIMRAMKKEYGDKRGESVFYASANKGRIRDVDNKRRKRA